jgi:hypothetical protein
MQHKTQQPAVTAMIKVEERLEECTVQGVSSTLRLVEITLWRRRAGRPVVMVEERLEGSTVQGVENTRLRVSSMLKRVELTLWRMQCWWQIERWRWKAGRPVVTVEWLV